jgi:hypothetical protein
MIIDPVNPHGLNRAKTLSRPGAKQKKVFPSSCARITSMQEQTTTRYCDLSSLSVM